MAKDWLAGRNTPDTRNRTQAGCTPELPSHAAVVLVGSVLRNCSPALLTSYFHFPCVEILSDQDIVDHLCHLSDLWGQFQLQVLFQPVQFLQALNLPASTSSLRTPLCFLGVVCGSDGQQLVEQEQERSSHCLDTHPDHLFPSSELSAESFLVDVVEHQPRLYRQTVKAGPGFPAQHPSGKPLESDERVV